jgi:hypothetical protein
MEKVKDKGRSLKDDVVSRKFEMVITGIILLILSEIVGKRIGLVPSSSDEELLELVVLVLLWAIVKIVTELTGENTLLGKLINAYLLPKVEARIREVYTDVIASDSEFNQRLPSDKELSSAIDELNEDIPGDLPK